MRDGRSGALFRRSADAGGWPGGALVLPHMWLQQRKQGISALRRSYAKGFGFMGAVFAGSECVIEKSRAQHDIYNSVYAGCVTGGALAYRAGPAAMCGGCATFAAFSALIDKVMEHD